MKYTTGIDGQPLCPDCGACLSCSPAGDRDTETMGGYGVEYYKCESCDSEFEVIEDDIFPSGDLV